MKSQMAFILAISVALGTLPLTTAASWGKGGGGGHGGGGHGGGGHGGGGHGGGGHGGGTLLVVMAVDISVAVMAEDVSAAVMAVDTLLAVMAVDTLLVVMAVDTLPAVMAVHTLPAVMAVDTLLAAGSWADERHQPQRLRHTGGMESLRRERCGGGWGGWGGGGEIGVWVGEYFGRFSRRRLFIRTLAV